MHGFDLLKEQVFNPTRHVAKTLCELEEGDVTIACWEPGQNSPYHCHPYMTEIYFCFQGSGKMKNREETVDLTPSAFVVHPPGELHEYRNGPERSILYRVRFGGDKLTRSKEWPSHTGWKPRPEDIEYFKQNQVD